MLMKKDDNMFGKKIFSSDKLIEIELKGLKGKEEDGIFIQVSYTREGKNLSDEVVISQIVQNGYTKKKYNCACLCLAPMDNNCKDTEVNFMVGILDETMQIS
jgi:hypothetical protein